MNCPDVRRINPVGRETRVWVIDDVLQNVPQAAPLQLSTHRVTCQLRVRRMQHQHLLAQAIAARITERQTAKVFFEFPDHFGVANGKAA